MKLVLLVSALMLPCCPGAWAQEAPPPSSHEQAALELFAVMNLERQMMAGASTMVDVMIRQNPTLGPFRDVVLDWAESFMTMDEFAPELVPMYTKAFSEPELRELATFYRSPIGQKTLRVLPEMTTQTGLLGARLAEAHQGELQAAIAKRAAELEQSRGKQ